METDLLTSRSHCPGLCFSPLPHTVPSTIYNHICPGRPSRPGSQQCLVYSGLQRKTLRSQWQDTAPSITQLVLQDLNPRQIPRPGLILTTQAAPGKDRRTGRGPSSGCAGGRLVPPVSDARSRVRWEAERARGPQTRPGQPSFPAGDTRLAWLPVRSHTAHLTFTHFITHPLLGGLLASLPPTLSTHKPHSRQGYDINLWVG